MASLVIAPSRNNIEHEVLLLLADEYRLTYAISMTNPGSLTMGFAGLIPVTFPWEGPFVVSRALKNNAYYLIDCRKPTRYVDTSGQETERPWNAEQLYPFYN